MKQMLNALNMLKLSANVIFLFVGPTKLRSYERTVRTGNWQLGTGNVKIRKSSMSSQMDAAQLSSQTHTVSLISILLRLLLLLLYSYSCPPRDCQTVKNYAPENYL